MPSYTMIAKVDQIVTKEVQLLINAGSEEEAEGMARRALQTYPKPTEEPGIVRMVTNKSHYWIPRDIEITEIKEDKKVA